MANAPAACENTFLNLRPQNILDALFVSTVPYMSNPAIVPLLEETIIGGVAAHVTDAGIVALGAMPGVHVTPDAVLHPTGTSFDAAAVDTQVAAIDPGAGFFS